MATHAEFLEYFNTVPGFDERLPVTLHHAVYPTIDPAPHFAQRTFAGKTVLVTGAAGGIGGDTAMHYAKAGAAVALVGRAQKALEDTRERILNEVPDARLAIVRADVRIPQEAEDAVRATMDAFGRLDVLVANAGVGATSNELIGEKDPVQWWNTFEVNVFGVFNFVRYAISHLKETRGYVVAVGSGMAQLRFKHLSDYSISKFTVNRLVEFIALEYPEVKVFSLHPGTIRTGINAAQPLLPTPDTTALPAATMLYLTTGNADWLNGRYVSSNWDLGEMEKDWKEKILAQQGLVNKLKIPV
ncbi:NAD-P-binding protein [Amylostereum chailletii]|nr:NAD-P-binding protein [Amylostereum chailletii]